MESLEYSLLIGDVPQMSLNFSSAETPTDIQLSAGNVRDVHKVADEPFLRLELSHQVTGLREEGATLRQEVPYWLKVSYIDKL